MNAIDNNTTQSVAYTTNGKSLSTLFIFSLCRSLAWDRQSFTIVYEFRISRLCFSLGKNLV